MDGWTATEIAGLISAIVAGTGSLSVAVTLAIVKLWPFFTQWRTWNGEYEAIRAKQYREGPEYVIVRLEKENNELRAEMKFHFEKMDRMESKIEALQQAESKCQREQAAMQEQVRYLLQELAEVKDRT